MKQAYEAAKAGAEDQEHIRTQIEQLNAQIKAINNAAVDYTETVRQFLESIEHDVFLTKMADALSLEVDAILRNKAEVQKYRENQLTPAEIEEVTAKVVDYLRTFSFVKDNVDIKQVVEHIMCTCDADAVEDMYSYLDATEIDAIKQFATSKQQTDLSKSIPIVRMWIQIWLNYQVSLRKETNCRKLLRRTIKQ